MERLAAEGHLMAYRDKNSGDDLLDTLHNLRLLGQPLGKRQGAMGHLGLMTGPIHRLLGAGPGALLGILGNLGTCA